MRSYTIDRDLYDLNEITFDILNFKQGDSNQELKIKITNKGESVNLTGYTVVSNILLPDNTKVQLEPKIQDDTITIVLNATALSQVGFCAIDIQLSNAQTSTTIFTVKYRVISSIVFDSVGISSPVVNSGNSVAVQSGGKKYAILAFAGQSNSVGYDESKLNPIFDEQTDPRLKQLGLYNDDNLQIIPLTHCVQTLQDMKAAKLGIDRKGTKGLHLPLSKLILKHIPEDYELLVIPVAYGGTAFTSGNVGTYNEELKKPNETTPLKWGVNTPYYRTLVDRIKYVLDMNPLNYYIGMVWSQGEFDFSNAQGHKQAFNEMTSAYFAEFNNDENYKNRVVGGVWDKSQWYIHDTTPYWKSGNQNATEVFNGYKEWATDSKTFVELDFGSDPTKYTNQTNGAPKDVTENGVKVSYGSTSSNQGTHFGNNAYTTLVAPAVYKKMLDNNLFKY